MSIFIPIPTPSLTVNTLMLENLGSTLSTEFFGATLFVLILSLSCCVFLLWKNRKNSDGKGIFLYLATFFLLTLLFTLVSSKEEQNDYCNDSEKSNVDYDIIVRGDRILVYEQFNF